MIVRDRRTDAEWARDNVERFPRSWRARLLTAWHRAHQRDRRAGNLSLLARVRTLSDAERGGIRPDASDGEICQRADLAARDMTTRMELWAGLARRRAAALRRWGDAYLERVKTFSARALMFARGLLDLWPESQTRRSALLRVQGARFWRRVYRRLHARTVEACAIDLGLVRKTVGAYASDDSVRRCQAQDSRNSAVLDSITAVNDHGQTYTLSDLAARGVANKAIRRMELLTRIAGFEHIAKQTGHIGFMVTMTCPSRFHRAATKKNGAIFNNPRYDHSTPDVAQRYLSQQWARCRAAAMRSGLDWYGFRIAEPQHDGTPHWHVLLFMPPQDKHCTPAQDCLRRLVKKYFLDNESPNEPGAQQHRIDFEAIDWAKGSAVGYVIKYVSKNIDGFGVGTDLFGQDAITSSQRVTAWARTWRIRQFQQIGGAPVGVWRELRRLHPDNIAENAPEALRMALSAVNVGKIEPGAQALAWAKYTNAQGGIGTPRRLLRIRLLTEQTGELGQYGEPLPKRPVGVWTMGVEFFKNHIHVLRPDAPSFQRRVIYRIESERAEWVIQSGDVESVRAVALERHQRSAEGASTRIHVNNCTDPARRSDFATNEIYRVKLRKWVDRSPREPQDAEEGADTPPRRHPPAPPAPHPARSRS